MVYFSRLPEADVSVTIPISVVRDFVTTGPIQGYEVLADVPTSVSHFPQVDQLVPLGDDKYRWEMERMGTQNHYFQVRYVTRYTRSESKAWIRWTPIKEGNGLRGGCWNFAKRGTRPTFILKTQVTWNFHSHE